jgi:mono/diheme cytochrome c family protein
MTLRSGEWIVIGGSVLISTFAALVGTLIYLKPPPVMYWYAESPAANLGEAIYKRESCRDCHQVFGNGSTSGPKLDGIGALRSVSILKAYLLDPVPGVGDKTYRVKMPSYARLSQEDRDALVAYLLALSPLTAQNADHQ